MRWARRSMSESTPREEDCASSGDDPPLRLDPDSSRPAVRIVVLCVAALVLAALWVVYAATHHTTKAQSTEAKRLLVVDRPFPIEGRFEGDPYVGPQVCAECHPAEAASIPGRVTP